MINTVPYHHVRAAHTAPDKLDALMPEFVRDNAGKAFEFMVEKADEDRKAAGLGTIAESFAGERNMEKKTRKAHETPFFFLWRHQSVHPPLVFSRR